MRISDWSSDVCSSDLGDEEIGIGHGNGLLRPAPIWLRPARVQPGPSGVADPAAPGEGGIKGFDSGEARRAQHRFVFFGADRQSVGKGKMVSVSVDLGGGGTIKKTQM